MELLHITCYWLLHFSLVLNYGFICEFLDAIIKWLLSLYSWTSLQPSKLARVSLGLGLGNLLEPDSKIQVLLFSFPKSKHIIYGDLIRCCHSSSGQLLYHADHRRSNYHIALIVVPEQAGSSSFTVIDSYNVDLPFVTILSTITTDDQTITLFPSSSSEQIDSSSFAIIGFNITKPSFTEYLLFYLQPISS